MTDDIKIFKAKSASDSAFMIKTPYIYKIWFRCSLTESLDYESQVYKKITDDILSKYPNAPFIRYARGGRCENFKKFVEMFNLNISQSNKIFNILFSERIKRILPNRNDVSNLSVGFTATQYCDDCVPLIDIIKKDNRSGFISWSYLCICFGLQLLYMNRISHNDLHSGNVFVDQSDSIPKFKIFDFDRAYIEHQNNPILNNGLFCERVSSCNFLNDYNRDIYYILQYYMRYMGKDSTLFKFLKLLIPDQDDQIIIVDFYLQRIDKFFQRVGTEKSILKSPSFMRPILNILKPKLETTYGLKDFLIRTIPQIIQDVKDSEPDMKISPVDLRNAWNTITIKKEQKRRHFTIVYQGVAEDEDRKIDLATKLINKDDIAENSIRIERPSRKNIPSSSQYVSHSDDSSSYIKTKFSMGGVAVARPSVSRPSVSRPSVSRPSMLDLSTGKLSSKDIGQILKRSSKDSDRKEQELRDQMMDKVLDSIPPSIPKPLEVSYMIDYDSDTITIV